MFAARCGEINIYIYIYIYIYANIYIYIYICQYIYAVFRFYEWVMVRSSGVRMATDTISKLISALSKVWSITAAYSLNKSDSFSIAL